MLAGHIFVGYPASPGDRVEAIREACQELRESGLEVTTWEELQVGGHLIISEIKSAIDEAGLCIFDVTDLNPNVLFELGYAIGAKKPIWLLRNDASMRSQQQWNDLRLMSTIGYVRFTNSLQITEAFWRELPHQQVNSLYETLIEPALSPQQRAALFYIRSIHENQAGLRLTQRIYREERRDVRCIVDDPQESGVQSLTWYAQQIYQAQAIVAHFSSPESLGAAAHNARCALVSGLAMGMQRPILMLGTEEYMTPVDYREYLYRYQDSRDCVAHTDAWLQMYLANARDVSPPPLARRPRLLAVELRDLRLGDPVAEVEQDDLSRYFVETASYREVLADKTTVFVGPKGTGKSANVFRAAAELSEDHRNLVCTLRPQAYEIESVVRLLREYRERAELGYLIESLWKFLIYSEIANAAVAEIESRRLPPDRNSPEQRLLDYARGPGAFLAQDFAVRLETAVERVLGSEIAADGVGSERARLSELLHENVLRELRSLLGDVLHDKERVAVLVDNLDKAWDTGADIRELATFLLGLLGCVERISEEFRRDSHWRRSANVTLAVFVRSDIFRQVQRVSREPDKIPASRLAWSDSALLLRVAEERYAKIREGSIDGKALWEHFPSYIKGVPLTRHITERILPRPRDLLFFCAAAVTVAVNRGHDRVQHEDLEEAERTYSQFALQAATVESDASFGDMEALAYEFAGMSPIITRDALAEAAVKCDIATESVDELIRNLRALSFIGIEVGAGEYRFNSGARDDDLIDALARRHALTTGRAPSYQIHPAFRTYLELRE